MNNEGAATAQVVVLPAPASLLATEGVRSDTRPKLQRQKSVFHLAARLARASRLEVL